MAQHIEGLKLIKHTGGVNLPDDPTIPYRLDVNLRPPEFMDFTFIMLYGSSEEVVVRGPTREAIDRFVAVNDFLTHPRLRRLSITGPEGVVFQHPAPVPATSAEGSL